MGAEVFDLRIDGGILIDGSGAPGVRADLGVRAGKIVAVGKELRVGARQTIDASGLVVTPGFIDIHTHYDAQTLWDRSLSPSSLMGVTTVVGGNCGFSIAPLSGSPDDTDYLMRMLARVEGIPLESLRAGGAWDWRSFGAYLDRIDGTLALNAGFLVGHSALRRTVMGERANREPASPQDLQAMQVLLRESLAAGGLGFSSTVSPGHNDDGGKPVPSRFATREELIALAAVVGEFPGTTLGFHPPIATAFDNDQLNLMIDMSLAAGRPLNWNMLTPFSQLPEICRSQMASCEIAAARGARLVPLVSAQVNSTWVNFVSGFILDMYPGWAEVIGLPLVARKAALSDPAVRRRLDEGAHSAAAGRRALGANWAEWTFTEVFADVNRPWQGLKVGEVARRQNKTPFDTMLDVVLADDLRTVLQMSPVGDDDETWRMRAAAWHSEHTIVGASDAGAHLDMIDSFASFLQVLEIGVRERGLISLEQAVRQLTSVPAQLMGFHDRGLLGAGYRADIAVFDPASIARGPIHSRSDLPGNAARLYAEAIGMEHVIVNGTPIVRGRTFLDVYPGQLLRSGRDTRTVALPA